MVSFAGKPINWAHILMPMSFVLAWYVDKQQQKKLTAFRNKSALFKRELKPGETETWT